MHRQLRQLDRWYDARDAPRPERADGLRRFSVAGTTLVIAVFATAQVLQQQGIHVGLDGLSRRVGSGPAEAAPGQGSHEYMAHQTGRPDQPVGYDPCTPIRVVVNTELAPSNGDEIIRAALDETSRATGLTFVDAGTTHELPRARGVRRDTRTDRDRPTVLIAWTTPKVVPELAGRVAGLGGSVPRPDQLGRLTYVYGTISLDSAVFWKLAARPEGAEVARAIVMHELGHVVGLDHVDDRHEVMYGETVGVTSWGPGDLTGLQELGQLPCRG